ncbi:MAG: amidase [Gammaproteobacteria bacterium]|nr:MAG: amidase [Gammaproteobacteria bacterium]
MYLRGSSARARYASRLCQRPAQARSRSSCFASVRGWVMRQPDKTDPRRPTMDRHNTTDPADLCVLEAHELMRAGELSTQERLEASLRRIERLEPQLHAFARLYPAVAEGLARDAQRRLSDDSSPSPLCGQPVALKDWFKVAGLPLEAGSRAWKGYVADVDCTLWDRLRANGAVLVGHAHSFEPVTAPPTRNPWDPDRSPGGSSAGSAVAVATGMVPVALGTETTQSLRQPASHCGVSTIKPSYGQLSLFGVFGFIRSYDNPGVLGRSVQDCSITLQTMLGTDLRDDTTYGRAGLPALPVNVEPADRPYAGLRFGIPDGLGRPDPGVAGVWTRACQEAEALGAELVPVAADMFDDAYASPLEAEIVAEQRRLGLYPDRVEEYGAPFRAFLESIVQRNIGLADYIAARREREARMRLWAELFRRKQLAAILLPSCEFEAKPFGSGGQLDARYMRWSNLCGLPAVGFPGGLSAETGLPVGLSLVGALDDDASVITLALHYQMHYRYHLVRPHISSPGQV